MTDQTSDQEKDSPTRMGKMFDGPMIAVIVIPITIYLLAAFAALLDVQVALWGSVPGKENLNPVIKVLGAWFPLSTDMWLFLMVATAGALGSFVHAATSLADFVGNRTARRSWSVWFILRPFIGSSLAIVFYLVIRAGLIAQPTDPGTFNIYGFAGMAAITGLFSKQATDKLREVFDTLFRTKAGGGDDARQNNLKPDSANGHKPAAAPGTNVAASGTQPEKPAEK